MSASTPLVSVVLTVFRRLDYLGEALQSVAAQSFEDYEVIVADDSGSAAARAIVTPVLESGRVRYQPNAETLGVALSLRSALATARGRYIAILNDDDVWEPEFLARLVTPLEADDRRVLAFCDHWIVTEDGEIDHLTTEHNTAAYGRRGLQVGDIANPRALVLQKNAVPLAMGSVFRAAALDSSKLVAEVAGAYDFWISSLLAASGGGFFYVSERLTRYRLHSQMETVRRSPEKSECVVFIWRSLLESGMFPELAAFIRSRLAQSRVRAGRDRLYFNQLAEARLLFREAFSTTPGWEPCASYLLSILPLSIRKAAGVSQA
jgi:glycosyltransferase involved in cell wall biosynthesis